MKRTLIKDTALNIGEKVRILGYIKSVRDHGKILFLDVKDRSAIVQVVYSPQKPISLKIESSIEIVGTVKKRPEKLINKNLITGEIEIDAESLKVINVSFDLPIDMTKETLDVELPTLLDHRPLTLKHKKVEAIFKVQENVANAFRQACVNFGCTEIFVPTITVQSTEGGAELFEISYYDHKAFLTQSPQLYKQIMVNVFERVFLFSHAYRAEPSITTRHLSEVVQMDCEIAFIDSFEELLDAAELIGVSMIKNACESSKEELKLFNIDYPKVPKTVPRLTLRQAQEIIKERTGVDSSKEMDLSPNDEKEICNWALEKHGSDFVTITHFPTKKRAFYTYPDPEDKEYSLSFDLLFRGLEISSGSQRINNYDDLVKAIKAKGMDPKNFDIYLQAFKYGMPKEGGFSFGLERVTMKILELGNVREASLFPRDMDRVDIKLGSRQ